MIPELGHFALIIAFAVAIVQSIVPLIGAAKNQTALISLARPAALTQFLFIGLAYAALTQAFVVHDFSVLYVSQHSNLVQPLMYRISGVWGSHEGSLLLWALILSLWTIAVAIYSKNLPEILMARVLAVMGMISTGFIAFMLFTSNPFERIFPTPLDGNELNPLLQDPGLAIHPPMLYMGYVGFSVAFAFAVAALLGGKLDATWARWSRPWTTIAWSFLTIGIALGSWWAYNELGWGGWWFWDPVENASFMPWLVGTALIHSLASTEKRGVFKSWTVLLAILAFSMSLLGTFIVRSGVLVSVHAFATDPARGVFILGFLVVVVGGSLALYAWRSATVVSFGRFQWFSRETALLLNNIIFLTATMAVFVGTMYPLVVDAFSLGKISVGRPYFDSMFALIAIPLLLLLGVGPSIRWKGDDWSRLAKTYFIFFMISLIAGLLIPFIIEDKLNLSTGLGLAGALWVALTTLKDLLLRIKRHSKLSLSYLGMVLAHFGVAVFVAGVTVTMTYSEEKDLRMVPGSSYNISGHEFRFKGTRKVEGPNYVADEAVIEVWAGDKMSGELLPQKRVYTGKSNPMTDASIDKTFTRDLYAALGEELEGGAWSMRVYYKPLIRWIWLGCIFMTIGGVLAVSDRRYRQTVKQKIGGKISVTAGV
ncbi:Cytochrome c heme lyase subunit CcmF [hydrothermal vent metagenome]|uniref:Cytochrome c heme lyase subunit CcmF n=1 Tax=hydrothermal vent metagenome TaxID=652676 RepID=A0A3B0WFF0_9ZZZZ